MRVLLTNDDGPESPSLPSLISSLSSASWISELTVILPAEEQSWIAQAVTRFKPLLVTEGTIAKHTVMMVNGTPSDCVSLGVSELLEQPPELVISGINVGANAGLPFFMSSGTVGAARQAFTFGIPAVALSAHVPEEVFIAWNDRNTSALERGEKNWRNLASLSTHFCEKLANLSSKEVDHYSINYPWEADSSTESVITHVERAHYIRLFEPKEDGTYVHAFKGLRGPSLESDEDGLTPEELVSEGDLTAIQRGAISITPLHYEVSLLDEKALSKISSILK